MLNALLYAITVLVWGSTWLALKFQVGDVPVVQSVLYRFTIAALILMGILVARRGLRRFDARAHALFAALGLFLFSINYVMFYVATKLGMTTGLLAVIFSSLISMNMINNLIFFGERPRPRPQVVVGALFGLVGIGALFAQDFGTLARGHSLGLGILLSIVSTYFASLGNSAARKLQQMKVDVLSANAFGMSYGVLFLLAASLATTHGFIVSTAPLYLASLAWLSILGTVVGFWAYLTLLGRIGLDRAAYVTILFPVVALILSSIFENYHWTALKLGGVGLILLSNLAVIGTFDLRHRRKNPVAPQACP